MKKIFLLDGYNLLYRAFYAVPAFTGPEGQPVNAVFGLAKMLSGFSEFERPDYLAVVMDSREPNFRVKFYPEYKATRDRMPDDLRAQEGLLFELFEALNVPVLSMGGYEADDIIGTLVTRLREDAENDTYVVSGDKDLYQFVGERVAVYDTMKRVTARRKEAIEKFGVPPERVVDYLAIVGDSSDNIPGIPGFGPKKAEVLITQFGSLESIYERVGETTGKIRETLEASRDVAFLSKKLATIDTAVPIDFDLESAKFHSDDFFTDSAKAFFRKLAFKSLLPKEESALKTFESLGIPAVNVSDAPELDRLLARTRSEGAVSLAAFSEHGRFAGVALTFSSSPECFVVRAKDVRMEPFLRGLLDSGDDVEISGFDSKSDLRLMLRYLGEAAAPADVAQGSLF